MRRAIADHADTISVPLEDCYSTSGVREIEAVPLTLQLFSPGAHERHVVDPTSAACCLASATGSAKTVTRLFGTIALTTRLAICNPRPGMAAGKFHFELRQSYRRGLGPMTWATIEALLTTSRPAGIRNPSQKRSPPRCRARPSDSCSTRWIASDSALRTLKMRAPRVDFHLGHGSFTDRDTGPQGTSWTITSPSTISVGTSNLVTL
jgi:hypothetical protein